MENPDYKTNQHTA